MKASTFENLIRKVVREEIDYALQREIKTLKEDLQGNLKPTITETPQISETAKISLREKIMGNTPVKQRLTHNFTANSALNDLLNETAMGDTNMESGNSPVSLSQPFASGAPLPMDTTGMPQEVANAVTRDYSSLMKAIIAKKGR
jgi:hypothetical protein